MGTAVLGRKRAEGVEYALVRDGIVDGGQYGVETHPDHVTPGGLQARYHGYATRVEAVAAFDALPGALQPPNGPDLSPSNGFTYGADPATVPHRFRPGPTGTTCRDCGKGYSKGPHLEGEPNAVEYGATARHAFKHRPKNDPDADLCAKCGNGFHSGGHFEDDVPLPEGRTAMTPNGLVLTGTPRGARKVAEALASAAGAPPEGRSFHIPIAPVRIEPLTLQPPSDECTVGGVRLKAMPGEAKKPPEPEPCRCTICGQKAPIDAGYSAWSDTDTPDLTGWMKLIFPFPKDWSPAIRMEEQTICPKCGADVAAYIAHKQKPMLHEEEDLL